MPPIFECFTRGHKSKRSEDTTERAKKSRSELMFEAPIVNGDLSCPMYNFDGKPSRSNTAATRGKHNRSRGARQMSVTSPFIFTPHTSAMMTSPVDYGEDRAMMVEMQEQQPLHQLQQTPYFHSQQQPQLIVPTYDEDIEGGEEVIMDEDVVEPVDQEMEDVDNFVQHTMRQQLPPPPQPQPLQQSSSSNSYQHKRRAILVPQVISPLQSSSIQQQHITSDDEQDVFMQEEEQPHHTRIQQPVLHPSQQPLRSRQPTFKPFIPIAHPQLPTLPHSSQPSPLLLSQAPTQYSRQQATTVSVDPYSIPSARSPRWNSYLVCCL